MPLIRRDGSAPTPPEDLEAALRSSDADERWRAVRALALQPGSAALLGAALRDEPDSRVREAIFTGLARLGAVDAVLPCLRSDDAALRTAALDALRAMIGAVRSQLPALLADGDSDIRILSCELTRELPAPEATKLLCAVLDRETLENVCGAAVEVLAEVGDESAIASLELCARRFAGHGFIGFAIQVAIERLRAQQDATR